MHWGIPFLLAPYKPSRDVRSAGSLREAVGHLLHNHSLLEVLERSLHCAYFGLLFTDQWLGMKLYVWAAVPIIVVLFLMIGEGE